MDSPTRKKRRAPRSRSGCLPCRQHHRKCDEQRPVCGLCRLRSRECQYGLRIAWGGRPFRKSNFGQCMASQAGSVVQIQSSTTDGSGFSRNVSPFVYGLGLPALTFNVDQDPAPDSLLEKGNDGESENQNLPLVQRKKARLPSGMPLSILQAPSFLPDLPSPYKGLLDYFTRVADSFSCDELVKNDFYATFIPIAVDTSHVMAALLNLAAVHRANSGMAQSPKVMAHLQVVTVEQLRSKLSTASGSSADAILATIVLLCYSEVVAGGDRSHSWRLHLEGAASIFSRDVSSWSMNSPNTTRAFISRCFVSLVALANVSGQPPSEAVSRQAMHMATRDGSSRYIDEFTAYSTDLVQILIEIGSLIRQRNDRHVEYGRHSPSDMEEQASHLIQRLQNTGSKSLVDVGSRPFNSLSSNRKEEYVSVDEAYHQAALLHIHQRVRGLRSSSIEIQTIVHKILDLVAGVKLLDGPCPGIVLLFPLFSAGCGAINLDDRNRVRTLLTDMVDRFGLKTVQQSLGLLEALWSHVDEHGESEASVSWERFIDSNTDLILY